MTERIFDITADYRPSNPNKPHYYVRAKTKKEAKDIFKSVISWLDIYNVDICEDFIANKIIAEPMKHIIL